MATRNQMMNYKKKYLSSKEQKWHTLYEIRNAADKIQNVYFLHNEL